MAWFRVATSSPARRRIFAYLAFARARAAGSTSAGGSTTQVRTYCNRELVRANCACTRVKSDCTCFAVFARVAAIRPLAELSPRHCRPVRVRSYRPQVLMKFSPASMIARINQLASQRWPNLRPAGARKSSPSENRQRCAPPTRISTLKFFRSWESSA